MKKIFNKKNRIFIFLFLVIIFLLFLKTISKKTKTEMIVTPTPSVTPYLKPTITETQKKEGTGTSNFYEKKRPEILNNYPLFDFIPYKTEKYSIDYLDPLILEIILKKDTPEIRQDVLDWISSKGVDPNTHKIIWKTK